jgi:predicted GIY-YIG superfamily endonuclease
MIPALDFSQLPSVPLPNRDRLPQCPGIYFAIDDQNRVLYIGLASNLWGRWKGQQHHRLEQLTRMHKKTPVRLAWLDCSDRPHALLELETYYIAFYDPLLNRTEVPARKITPAEVSLQQTLEKISKYVVIFGIMPADGKKPVTVCLRYLINNGRIVHTLRRVFQSSNRQPTGLRWRETVKRKRHAWWEAKCNGIRLLLEPWIDVSGGAFRGSATPKTLAGVQLLALTPLQLQTILSDIPVVAENFPSITAFRDDPIPLIWANLTQPKPQRTPQPKVKKSAAPKRPSNGGVGQYAGDLIPSPTERLTRQQQEDLMNWHPLFSGRCPHCEMPIPVQEPPQVHWDCPHCGWIDDTV